MKKIIGVVKDFFADFKDFWFLLKPQFKYGGAYYTLSFILYEIGQVGNNILWVYFYKVILDMAVAGESFLSIMTVIALFLLGVVVVDLLRTRLWPISARNGERRSTQEYQKTYSLKHWNATTKISMTPSFIRTILLPSRIIWVKVRKLFHIYSR